MNNSKIWLVVQPTVGIPLFLSAVAVGSFSVHVAVLSNTTWVSDFLAGRELGSSASLTTNTNVASTLNGVKVYAEENEKGEITKSATVVLPDGRSGVVTFSDPTRTAKVAGTSDTLE